MAHTKYVKYHLKQLLCFFFSEIFLLKKHYDTVPASYRILLWLGSLRLRGDGKADYCVITHYVMWQYKNMQMLLGAFQWKVLKDFGKIGET